MNRTPSPASVARMSTASSRRSVGSNFMAPTAASEARSQRSQSPMRGYQQPVEPRGRPIGRSGTSSPRQPTSRAPSATSSAARGPSPTPSGRGTSPSVRGTSPSRGRSPDTREGRMLTLVKDFQQLNLKPWGRRVESLESQMTRLRHLERKDVTFLEAAQSRNTSFMRNVEAIMEDAVREDAGIENGVVRHSYAAWTESNDLNHRIQRLLAMHGSDTVRARRNNGMLGGSGASHSSTAGSRPTSRTQSPAGRASSPGSARGTSPGAQSRRSTSVTSTYHVRPEVGIRGKVAPMPQNLAEVAPLPNRRAPSPLNLVRNGGQRVNSPARKGSSSTNGHASTTDLRAKKAPPSPQQQPQKATSRLDDIDEDETAVSHERLAMLEGLEGLAKRRALDSSDLAWAQSVFMRLYGAVDGPKQFNKWFDEKAARSVRGEL